MLIRIIFFLVLLAALTFWQGCGQSDFNDSEVNSAVKTTDTKTIIDTDNDTDNGEWVYLNDSSNANDFLSSNKCSYVYKRNNEFYCVKTTGIWKTSDSNINWNRVTSS